jgi:hypothetical protein
MHDHAAIQPFGPELQRWSVSAVKPHGRILEFMNSKLPGQASAELSPLRHGWRPIRRANVLNGGPPLVVLCLKI